MTLGHIPDCPRRLNLPSNPFLRDCALGAIKTAKALLLSLRVDSSCNIYGISKTIGLV